MTWVDYPGDDMGGYPNEWLLLARYSTWLQTPAIQAHAEDLSSYSTDIQLWTDDYSNLFQILK